MAVLLWNIWKARYCPALLLDDLRRKMIAGNWRHKTVSEAVELAEDIVMETSSTLNEVVIFPPFTALETVRGYYR